MVGERGSENYGLRAALTKAGLLPDELADRVGVDVKTVGRWLAGRTPHPRHRTRVAKTLGVEEVDLWPEATPTSATASPRSEIVGVWPRAEEPGRSDWRGLLTCASDRIDLLDFTLHDVITKPGVVDELAEKAAHGTEVRILIAEPASMFLAVRDQELGREPDPDDPDQRPVTRRELDEAVEALGPLLTRGVEVRMFVAERFNTILRFDDQLLLTLHLYGVPASEAPRLRLRRLADDGLFEQFAGHFEALWQNASEPLELLPDEEQDVDPEARADPEQAPTPAQAQRALLRLRGRRPL